MSQSSFTIKVTGLEVFAYHGVFAEEKKRGQRFIVDFTLLVEVQPGSLQDDINNTVNYVTLSRAVVEYVRQNQFNLIETLAEGLCELLLTYKSVRHVKVCVHKPCADIGHKFADLCIEVERSALF